MKIIKALKPEKYRDRSRYMPLLFGVHLDKQEKSYCLTLYCELEEDEDSQYPLEDLLDQYCVCCGDEPEELEIDGKQILIVEFECPTDEGKSMWGIVRLVGKRVFNYDAGDSVLLKIE